ncbi:MAG: M48 family metallopeptidase [Pseudomonadota bacterium]
MSATLLSIPDHRTDAGSLRLKIWAVIGLFAAPAVMAGLLGTPMVLLALAWTAGDTILVLLCAAIIFLHAHACVAVLSREPYAATGRRLIVVSRDQTPSLFDEVDAITRVLNLPPLDQIRIASSANATIAQRPRWFGLAGHSIELTLGLPIIQDTLRDVLRAVLAHELAHAARRDGVRCMIIARVLSQWRQLARVAKTHRFFGARITHRLASVFVAHFECLARKELHRAELAADSEARRIVGGAALALAIRVLQEPSTRSVTHPMSHCRLSAIEAVNDRTWRDSSVAPGKCRDLLGGYGPEIARFLS